MALLVVLTMLLFTYVKKISIETFSIYSAVEKIIPILCVGILLTKKLYTNNAVKRTIFALIAFLGWGIFISLLNGKNSSIIIYQIYHEIKYPTLFMIGCGISIRSRYLSSNRFNRFILLILVLCFLVIAFREIAPSAYNSLYKDGGHLGRGDFSDFNIVRHSGIFWHSSQLAVFSSLVIIYYISELKSKSKISTLTLCGLSVVCLLFSRQRFELLCLLTVISIYILVSIRVLNQRNLSKLLFIILISSLLVAPLSIFFIHVDLDKFREVPRFVFYSRSYLELIDSAFLGKGWGTIGSHAAADMTDAYNTIYWQQYWWIKEGLYSYDTFWPHIIGELGLPGLFLCVTLVCTMLNLFTSINSKLMFLFLVLTSLSSSNLQSFYYLLITFAMMIAAEKRYYGNT